MPVHGICMATAQKAATSLGRPRRGEDMAPLCALRHSMHHAGVGPLSMESYMGHTCITHGPKEKALSTALSFRSACTSLGLQRGSSFHLFSIGGKQIAGAPNFSHDVS